MIFVKLACARATLYACFLPCLIQLFFEKFQRETRNSIEVFRKNNKTRQKTGV